MKLKTAQSIAQKIFPKNNKILMHDKKGFSLISFLVYLLIFSMVTTFICHIITVLIIPSFISLRKNQSVIAMHIATDCFVRDIKNIKNGQDAWHMISPHELIWSVGDHNVGWSFTDHRLERREGMYQKGWKEVKTSIIAKNLSKAVFTPEKDHDRIKGITLTLTPLSTSVKAITCYVAVEKQENHEKK